MRSGEQNNLDPKVLEPRFTVSEAAIFLKCNSAYLYMLIRLNKLNCFISNKVKYVLIEDVIKIKNNRMKKNVDKDNSVNV